MKYTFHVCILLACVEVCFGSNILVVYPLPTRGHTILGDGVVRNLLKAGHNVTYITPFPGASMPNLRRIIADNTAMPEKLLNISALMKKEIEMTYDGIFHAMYNISKLILEHKEVQLLMNNPREKFDVVIAEWLFNDVYSGFSAVFNCPYIWTFVFEPNFVSLSLIDEATNPAYTPNEAFSYEPPFTFTQRVELLGLQLVASAASSLYYYNMEKGLYDKVFREIVARKGHTLPPYEDIRLNASMAFGNTHVSYGTNIRLPQNFKSIGGYHVEPDVKPLPVDLKKIMDNSKHGVIYFSMGSNLKSKDFPVEVTQSLLKMFGSLTQTVLWKFEETLPNLPKNVYILKWAPQPSILAHPNCVLFITKGGMLSTIEAIHFGVPFIGIPIFFEQYNNVDRAVRRGYARKAILSEDIAKDLKAIIHEMTNNSQYKQNMKEVSFIYHNRPVPPGLELVHWVEHVIATKGALHLRSPALHVAWYQKIYLDLLVILALIFFLLKTFIQALKCKTSRKLKQKML